MTSFVYVVDMLDLDAITEFERPDLIEAVIASRQYVQIFATWDRARDRVDELRLSIWHELVDVFAEDDNLGILEHQEWHLDSCTPDQMVWRFDYSEKYENGDQVDNLTGKIVRITQVELK